MEVYHVKTKINDKLVKEASKSDQQDVLDDHYKVALSTNVDGFPACHYESISLTACRGVLQYYEAVLCNSKRRRHPL